jgi:hypothetical protein
MSEPAGSSFFSGSLRDATARVPAFSPPGL